MLLKYFYDDKIAHASYMVGCQAYGTALIIDPGRDIDMYLAAAAENDMKIVAAAETHIHADLISGSRELNARVGAKMILSDEGDENWKYEYVKAYPAEQFQLVKDGDTFMIGNIKVEIFHSPGHTPEHISFIITDTAGANRPMGIFTGDFVFVGDVGRPDLLEEAAGIKGTAEPGARAMFKSLQRFKQLPDYMQVWPAHGAGSACGKALGAIPSSTIGYEKLFNWALSYDNEADFVKALLAGQPEPPTYFAMMKKLNKIGPPILGGQPQPPQLDLARLKSELAGGAKIIDTRASRAYAAGHIPGTLNIPHDKSFTNWAGWLLDFDHPFYLITDPGNIQQVMRDLTYIGLDNCGGFFDGSILAEWDEARESYAFITPAEIAGQLESGHVTLLDVRGQSEWDEGHIPGAMHIMLGRLVNRINDIPTNKPVVVHCRTDARSAIGASVLQAKGITNVTQMLGGYQQWAAEGRPLVKNGN